LSSSPSEAALAHVRGRAERQRPGHRERIARALDGVDADTVLAGVTGPLTLNFHPDRLLADGRTTAEALAEEGVYRSQFETGISSGGLTAHRGGDRDRWEDALFGGAYRDAPAEERPKYGGLNLMRHRNGACAGFGSCHLRLRPEALGRATLIFGDSNAEPDEIGLIDAFEPVLAPLLEHAASTGRALGRDATAGQLADGLARGDAAAGRGLFAPAMCHSLEEYVEAQVHGVVSLADAEAIVIDRSFAGTPAGERLQALGLPVEWHDGHVLAVADVPVEPPGGEPREWKAFCAGGRARALAERMAPERLDAASIGAAAVSVVREPAAWADWGTPAEVLQLLKYEWRILVRYGQPSTRGQTPA
jgi:hypothetical protein